MSPMKVYVAGPYSTPDPCENTYNAVDLGTLLLDEGFVPFIPHLSHFWHTMRPRPYKTWIAYDLEWVAVCDVVYRLPGHSPGSDGEVAFAAARGIPVVYSIDALIALRESRVTGNPPVHNRTV